MGKLSLKLRSIEGGPHRAKGFVHWCPGCESPHAIWTERGPESKRPIWTWNGDAERPTTTPSVRCFTTFDAAGVALPTGQERTLCHYFLTDGSIVFCGDCAHALAGKTVPLPDFPYAEFGGT